jgi:hypothetical protein
LAKHTQSEVKKPDRFVETLTPLWEKAEPYALRVGIGLTVVLVLVGIWAVVRRGSDERSAAVWARHFAIRQKARGALRQAADPDERDRIADQLTADLLAFAKEQRRTPAAAIALLEVSQEEFSLADQKRTTEPEAAKSHLTKAAEAAEQFLETFREHRLAPLAAYTAGCARLELGDHRAAATHFEGAQACPVGIIAALARLHAGHCYEKLGRIADAERLYDELRKDPWAAWAAQQAEFRLSQIRAAPPDGS